MRSMRILLGFVLLVTMVGVTQADLIITEIMKDPLVYSDNYAEWFEIYNNGVSSVDLAGYTISDNYGDLHMITVLVIGAGEVSVLGKHADPNHNGNVDVDYVYSGFNLDDGADEIILRNAGGGLVDEVWYDDGTLWPNIDGTSLMLTDYDSDNNDPANWTVSTIAWAGDDFGSPGEFNEGAYTPPTLVINEIMYNPLDASDNYGEWFEVYNAGGSAANLRLWYLTDNGVDYYRWVEHYWIQPGEFAILAKHADPNHNGNVDEDWVYSGFNLDETADEIVLTDLKGNLIDEVWYDMGSGWPDIDGASIYLNNLGADNNNGANWEISTVTWFGDTGDFGSPGETNQTSYTIPEFVISEIMYDPHAASDNYAEWFEVYNAGGSAANLRLWYLTDDGGDSYRWVEHYWIQPGEFAILAKHADPNHNGGVDENWVYNGINLDDTDDEIILTDLRGNLIDEVWYDEGNGWIEAYGASVYLNDLSADNNDGANWEMSTVAWTGSAGDFGSPGEANQAGYTIPELVISEIMYDPYASSDNYGEWFEVYNIGAEAANIRLWVFTDNGSDSFTPQTDFWLQPGEYYVFAKHHDPNHNGGVDEDYVYSGTNFDNTDDEIIIHDIRGNLIEIVEYSPANLFPDPYGASIFLIDLELDNSIGTNWAISTIQWPGSAGDFGSPGEENQTIQGVPNIIITEFMADPYASNDAYGEWFELYNTEVDSVNMRYWDFMDNGGQIHTITEDLWIHAGEYMLLAKHADPNHNGGIEEDYVFSGLSFDDIEDEIIIIDTRGNTIDEVWYDATFIKHFGASFYLLDLETDNNVGTNWAISDIQWTGSMGDFGSPGEANQSPQPVPQVVITEIMIDPDASSDSYGEWFELYNASGFAVNMRYWEFFDDGGQTHTITDDLWIASNEYLVFAKHGNPDINGGVDEDYVYSGISMDNIDDELIIEDIQYQIIDEVGWLDDPSWPHPVGASIFILNPFEDNSLGTAWTASTELWPGSAGDFGSPGVANFDAYLILTATVDTVPVDGGNVVYDGRVISNLPNMYENIRYWTEVTTPNSITIPFSSMYLTVYPFMDVTVTDNIVPIPAGAPGGIYTFTGRIGYPTIFISDSFEFTKDGASADGWTREQWESLFGVAGDGESISATLPLEYEVGNAYPNPFNPTATIEIALPDAGRVNVVVYNTIGQRVATVADAAFQAGWHSFTFDGSALASGVYFVRVDVPGQLTEMQKIVLMK